MQQENSDSCSFTGSAAVNDTDDNEPESLNKAEKENFTVPNSS